MGLTFRTVFLTNDRLNLSHLPHILSLLNIIKKEFFFTKSIYDDSDDAFRATLNSKEIVIRTSEKGEIIIKLKLLFSKEFHPRGS